MSLDTTVWDAIVIGAGMSGLAARRTLVENGLSSLTLEKSRGLGGRASTRRMDGNCADLGAQFTSAKGSYWQSLIANSQDDEVIAVFLQSDSNHPRYVHAQGLSRLAGIVGTDPYNPRATIQKETKVSRFELASSGTCWEVTDQYERKYQSRALVITLPVPQAMELLSKAKLSIDRSQRQRLENVQYTRCLSAAFVTESETNLDPPGILKNPSAEISGIFDQRKKGLITSLPTIVVQSSPQLSRDHWDEPTEVLLALLWKYARAATRAAILPGEFKSGWLQKWKYCEPLQPLDSLSEKISIKQAPPLLLAGDAFGGSKIEGAINSGREAALTVFRCLR